MKKQIKTIFTLLVFSSLASCTTIVRTAQHYNAVPFESYPAAPALNAKLASHPPVVNLSLYKSVHSRNAQKDDIAIALASSGGGYRAANLTLGVLAGLEKLSTHDNSNLLKSVDYYSTVSGSGLAIGYYLDQYYNYQMTHHSQDFSLNEAIERLQHAKKNPLIDDLSRYLFFGKNRNLTLEAYFNHSIFTTSKGDLTLGDIFIPKDSDRQVLLPYWAANATIYQNVAIFPFTPDIIHYYRVNGYYHNNVFTNLISDYNFPVSIGVTASSSVPFITPPTTLSSTGCTSDDCYLHLMDGGIADNLAVYTALNFLQQDNSKTKVLIVVDASKTATQPFSQSQDNPNAISTVERLLGALCDVNRQHLKPNINFITHKLLKNKNTQNVIVVYLDLEKYPDAQSITTNLALSRKEQNILIKTGEDLVASNKKLKSLAAMIGHLDKKPALG